MNEEILGLLHSKDSVSFVNEFQNNPDNVSVCIELLSTSDSGEIQLFAAKSFLKLVKLTCESMSTEAFNDLATTIISLCNEKKFKLNAVVSILGESLIDLGHNDRSSIIYIFETIINSKNNPNYSLILLKEIIQEYSNKNDFFNNGMKVIKQSSMFQRIYEFAKEFLENFTENSSLLLQKLFSIDVREKRGEIRVNQPSDAELIMTTKSELNFLFDCYLKKKCYSTLEVFFYIASSSASSFNIHGPNSLDDDNLGSSCVFDLFFGFIENILREKTIFGDQNSIKCVYRILFALSRNITSITSSFLPVLDLTYNYFITLSIRDDISQYIMQFTSMLLLQTSNQSGTDVKMNATSKISEIVAFFLDKLFNDQLAVKFANEKEESFSVISKTIQLFHTLFYTKMMQIITNEPKDFQIALFIYLSTLFIKQMPLSGCDTRLRPEQKIITMTIINIMSGIEEHSNVEIEKCFCSFVQLLPSKKMLKKEEVTVEKEKIAEEFSAEEVEIIRNFESLETQQKVDIIFSVLMQDLTLSARSGDDTFVENVIKSIFNTKMVNEEAFTFIISNEELDAIINPKQRRLLYECLYNVVINTHSYPIFYQRIENIASYDDLHFFNLINNLIGVSFNFIKSRKVINKNECSLFLNWFLGDVSNVFIQKVAQFIDNFEIIKSLLKFWKNICLVQPMFGKHSQNGIVMIKFTEALLSAVMPVILASDFSDGVASLFKHILLIIKGSLSIGNFPYYMFTFYKDESIKNIMHCIVEFFNKFGIESILPYPNIKQCLIECLKDLINYQLKTIVECENDIIPISFSVLLSTLNESFDSGQICSSDSNFIFAKALARSIYCSQLFDGAQNIIVENFSEQFAELLGISLKFYLTTNQSNAYIIPYDKIRFVTSNFPNALEILHQKLMELIPEEFRPPANELFENFAEVVEDTSARDSQIESCMKEIKKMLRENNIIIK